MGVIRNISVKVFEENIPDLMKKAMGHFGHLISGMVPLPYFQGFRADLWKIVPEKAMGHFKG